MTTKTLQVDPLFDLLKYGPIRLSQPMSLEEFAAFSSRYAELQMERDKSGKVIIMSPVKSGSGKSESKSDGVLR